jgi:hypothetical protein
MMPTTNSSLKTSDGKTAKRVYPTPQRVSPADLKAFNDIIQRCLKEGSMTRSPRHHSRL